MAYCDMQNGFAGGNCWFDAMQLEEGLTLNHFNMVQNSDFSAVGTDGKPKAWTVGKNDASYVEVLPLEAPKDEFHAPDCLKHDNTQKIRLAGRYDRTITSSSGTTEKSATDSRWAAGAARSRRRTIRTIPFTAELPFSLLPLTL